MPRESTPTTSSIETKKKKLAYDVEFRKMLRENPGIIKTAIALSEKAEKEWNPKPVDIPGWDIKVNPETGEWTEKRRGSPYKESSMAIGRGTFLSPGEPIIDEKTGLEVTILGKSNRSGLGGFSANTRRDVGSYFRINFNGHSYFVKKNLVTNNPGALEFNNTLKVKEILKDLDFVKVIDARLGYQDQKQSWYVSGWEELENAGYVSWDALDLTGRDDHGRKVERLETPETEKEYQEVKSKVRLIVEKLRRDEFNKDVATNLFYNRKTKSFILLDITGKNPGAEWVGDPFDVNKQK